MVRDGSAILMGEFGQEHVSSGNVILLGANILCRWEPERYITSTVICADMDYLADQLYWQYTGQVRNHLTKRDFVPAICGKLAQTLRLDKGHLETLSPWLDELVELSVGRQSVANFYRMQALWFDIAHIIIPLVQPSPIPASLNRCRTTTFGYSRFRPLRQEARTAADLLRSDMAHHWTVAELAKTVHLSTSQLTRLFASAYGRPPIAYLTMLRTERMAGLLRGTNLPIAVIARLVGWDTPDFATRQFRRNLGVTPRQYRRSRPESLDRPSE